MNFRHPRSRSTQSMPKSGSDVTAVHLKSNMFKKIKNEVTFYMWWVREERNVMRKKKYSLDSFLLLKLLHFLYALPSITKQNCSKQRKHCIHLHCYNVNIPTLLNKFDIRHITGYFRRLISTIIFITLEKAIFIFDSILYFKVMQIIFHSVSTLYVSNIYIFIFYIWDFIFILYIYTHTVEPR